MFSRLSPAKRVSGGQTRGSQCTSNSPSPLFLSSGKLKKSHKITFSSISPYSQHFIFSLVPDTFSPRLLPPLYILFYSILFLSPTVARPWFKARTRTEFYWGMLTFGFATMISLKNLKAKNLIFVVFFLYDIKNAHFCSRPNSKGNILQKALTFFL